MAEARMLIDLPASLHAERQGDVAILRLSRPQKRNALNDEAILGIEKFFTSLPDGIGALMSAIAQADGDAKARVKNFLEKRGPKAGRT